MPRGAACSRNDTAVGPSPTTSSRAAGKRGASVAKASSSTSVPCHAFKLPTNPITGPPPRPQRASYRAAVSAVDHEACRVDTVREHVAVAPARCPALQASARNLLRHGEQRRRCRTTREASMARATSPRCRPRTRSCSTQSGAFTSRTCGTPRPRPGPVRRSRRASIALVDEVGAEPSRRSAAPPGTGCRAGCGPPAPRVLGAPRTSIPKRLSVRRKARASRRALPATPAFRPARRSRGARRARSPATGSACRARDRRTPAPWPAGESRRPCARRRARRNRCRRTGSASVFESLHRSQRAHPHDRLRDLQAAHDVDDFADVLERTRRLLADVHRAAAVQADAGAPPSRPRRSLRSTAPWLAACRACARRRGWRSGRCGRCPRRRRRCRSRHPSIRAPGSAGRCGEKTG